MTESIAGKDEMNIGNKVVATKTIKLLNGEIYPLGAKGAITDIPPDKSVVHILFDRADSPCATMIKSIRREDAPPTIGEKIRRFFSSARLYH